MLAPPPPARPSRSPYPTKRPRHYRQRRRTGAAAAQVWFGAVVASWLVVGTSHNNGLVIGLERPPWARRDRHRARDAAVSSVVRRAQKQDGGKGNHTHRYSQTLLLLPSSTSDDEHEHLPHFAQPIPPTTRRGSFPARHSSRPEAPHYAAVPCGARNHLCSCIVSPAGPCFLASSRHVHCIVIICRPAAGYGLSRCRSSR